MKRTRSSTTGNLYDAAKDLQRSEEKIAEIAFIAGIDSSDLDTLTIDDLVEALRNSFPYTSPTSFSYDVCATDYIRQENFHLVIQARKYWWYRQLAIGAQSRG
jgi:hypothetical protein